MKFFRILFFLLPLVSFSQISFDRMDDKSSTHSFDQVESKFQRIENNELKILNLEKKIKSLEMKIESLLEQSKSK